MSKLPAFLSLFLFAFGSFTSLSQEDGPISPITVSFDLNQLKELDFGSDSLDLEKILFQLFPAPMSEDDPELSEWKTAAYWRCPSCKKKEVVVFEDEEEQEKELIPYDRNYTSGSYLLYYRTKDGTEKERAVASFSTSEMNDGTGRFTRGILSVAHFEKQNGKWKLINFNPFVNVQGSFTLASPVDGIAYDTHGKAYFLIHGGEANGVSAEDYWPLYQGLYLVDGESLQEMVHLRGANCQENGDPVGSIWDTEFTQIESTTAGMIATAKTTGLIVKEYNWYLPAALQFISKPDFELLPGRFNFEATQKIRISKMGFEFEKPMISIQYKDANGADKQQTITTQNTRVE